MGLGVLKWLRESVGEEDGWIGEGYGWVKGGDGE